MKVDVLHVQSQGLFLSGLLLSHKSSKMPNTWRFRVPSIHGWCSVIPNGATASHRQAPTVSLHRLVYPHRPFPRLHILQ